LGRWGEALAANWLRERGCQVLEANWRCRFGEIDLIVREGNFLCFVEVKLRRSAAYGQAGEFVENLKNTYDAQIAQGGTNLSGGQKQRLSIARAICRNPEIYIFDDSFSALDYKTDRVLRTELKKAAADKTMLIVAQRIGTIRDADKIIVLDEGEIAGMGTHSELMKNCEVYQQIALSQLSKEELENE